MLLALAAVVNYSDLLSPDIYRTPDGPAPPPGRLVVESSEPASPVEPIGPADALVKLEILYEPTNPCHSEIEPKAREFAAHYAPNVRLELLPWTVEGVEERGEHLDADCRLVLLISGTTDEDGREAEGVMYLGPTAVGVWSWDDVTTRVERRLAEAGIAIPPDDEASEVAGDSEDAADPTAADSVSSDQEGT